MLHTAVFVVRARPEKTIPAMRAHREALPGDPTQEELHEIRRDYISAIDSQGRLPLEVPHDKLCSFESL